MEKSRTTKVRKILNKKELADFPGWADQREMFIGSYYEEYRKRGKLLRYVDE